jgi:hypothetical protein
MDLSGLESADTIDTKDVRAVAIRIVWDHFGMVSSPGCSRIVPRYQLDRFPHVRKTVLGYARSYIATTSDRRANGTLGAVSSTVRRRFECRPFQDAFDE